MPRSLSQRVLVEHASGARKWVLRSRLSSLSPNWKRVPPKKRPAAKKPPAEPSAESAPVAAESSSTERPAPPDTEKE